MSRWIEQFQNHAFSATLASLKATLEDDELETANNEASIKEIARLNKVLKYIQSVIEQIDPELVQLSLLDTLNQHATNCIPQLNTFKGDQNIGHLNTANTYVDSMITAISQTPFVTLGLQKGALLKAANAYSETLDKHLSKVASFIDTEIEDEKTKLTKLEVAITASVSELASLNEKLKAVEQSIQQQTATFNTQFQTNETARNTKFEQIIIKLENKADEKFTELATKSEVIIKVLNSYQEKAAKVYGVVSNTLQAGAYSSYANEEKRSANFFRWSAIILMVIAVGILVVPEIIKIYKNLEDYRLDWRLTLGRVPFSLILFVPAFYLARESGKHRNTEVVNRRRELILSTIDPYLALFDPIKAEQIKSDIAKGVFSETTQTEDSSVSEASNVISQIVKVWLGK